MRESRSESDGKEIARVRIAVNDRTSASVIGRVDDFDNPLQNKNCESVSKDTLSDQRIICLSNLTTPDCRRVDARGLFLETKLSKQSK